MQVYLHRKGRGFERAQALGFEPLLLSELTPPPNLEAPLWIAFLCPDTEIGPLYTEVFSRPLWQGVELRFLLAHGYAVYAQELKLSSPRHQASLLAPKAIGPELLAHFQTHFPKPHGLAAAVSHGLNENEASDRTALLEISRALGFDPAHLTWTHFETEAIGDLISEQGLLCGGVFNLLDWTIQEMQDAGVPDSLIREECLTELELVARVIRTKGPSEAFRSISQAAQCGTVAMANRFRLAGMREIFSDQIQTVLNRRFAEYFRSGVWKNQAEDLGRRLSLLQPGPQPPKEGDQT